MMRSLLQEINWEVTADMTAELAWQYFSDQFNNIISQTVPTTRNRPKYKNFYINRETMRIRKRKQSYWNRCCHTLTPGLPKNAIILGSLLVICNEIMRFALLMVLRAALRPFGIMLTPN